MSFEYMSEFLSTESDKAGLPPGSLVHVGESHATQTKVTVVDYSHENIREHDVQTIDDILCYKESDSVTWVIFEGLSETKLIESIGRHFDIHSLVLEDILNTHQRPKYEESDDYLFFVFKGMVVSEDRQSVDYEQISIIVLNNFVFTFNEKRDVLFDSIKSRLRSMKGRIRTVGSDYLAYAIMDNIVDSYFSIQNFLNENIEIIENELFSNPTPRVLASIQRIRRELIFVRKFSFPLTVLLGDLLRTGSPLVHDSTRIYLRDVYDHVLRLTETIDMHRDIATGLIDIYHSSVSNKMNEVMKVLTVFASIFIPLTFIVGIYGMNFDYMPELRWKWAYPALWIAFIAIPVVLILYFRRKKWI